MAGLINILTRDERQACELAGRAALDDILARLPDEARGAIWHSIRCGYVQPSTGAAAPATAARVPGALPSV